MVPFHTGGVAWLVAAGYLVSFSLFAMCKNREDEGIATAGFTDAIIYDSFHGRKLMKHKHSTVLLVI